MGRDEILSRRTDREDSIALIQALAAENRRALERADLPTNNRNQYLAWFLGSPTAVKALRAIRYPHLLGGVGRRHRIQSQGA